MRRPILNPETLVEAKLDDLLGAIEDAMDGDAFTFCGPITYGVEGTFEMKSRRSYPKEKARGLSLSSKRPAATSK
jgi:hypothetical protein